MKAHEDTIVNPIYDWSDSDIWDYIKQNNVSTNPLYKKGYPRVGCIGCPLAAYHMRKKEFADHPKYKTLYIKAFDRMIEHRKASGLDVVWDTGEQVFDWWMEEYKRIPKGQMSLDLKD